MKWPAAVAFAVATSLAAGAVAGILRDSGAREWQVELTAGLLADALQPAPG